MNRRVFVVNVCLTLIAAAWSARADEPVSKSYIVFPIKTPLQRVLVGSSEAQVYVMVDVADTLVNDKFNLDRLDSDAFKSDLAAAAKGTGVAKPSLGLWLRYSGLNIERGERNRIESAVTKLCRAAGFAGVRVVSQFTGGTWLERMQALANMRDDENTNEACSEDDLVRAYPVRTKFSRFLFGEPTFDCYVELRQPIDGRFTEFSRSTKEHIAARVAELKLAKTRKISFNGMTTTAGEPRAEQFFTRSGDRPAKVDAFLQQLGFTESTWSHTPMSVDPEALLGKPAPDFTLKALDGSDIHLQDKIRGKVAVIAFWGVGCPACCVEAPYLTALQKQFGDEKLFVVGVNGYDESQNTVQKFAREKGLTHAIAMQGGKVAKNQYTVASYPVTYIIDREGNVADYRLDFEPGDEKHLAAAISKELANAGDKNKK